MTAGAEARALAPLERAKTMLQRALPAVGGGTLQERRDGYEAVLSQLPIAADASVTAAIYGGVDGYWVHADGASAERIGVCCTAAVISSDRQGLPCVCGRGVAGDRCTGLRSGVPPRSGAPFSGSPQRRL